MGLHEEFDEQDFSDYHYEEDANSVQQRRRIRRRLEDRLESKRLREEFKDDFEEFIAEFDWDDADKAKKP